MRLIVTNEARPSRLGALWLEALRPVQIRYPHPASIVECAFDAGAAILSLRVVECPDTRDLSRFKPRLAVGSVRLDYFPGAELARQWLAAAWAGYLMHEALECVTVDGRSLLDPHAEPYPDAPANRPLRVCMPKVLDEQALRAAIAVVCG